MQAGNDVDAKRECENLKAEGSIPGNVIEEQLPDDLLKFGNNSANDTYTLGCKEAGIPIHPARFPSALPAFFLKMLTEENDVCVDIFAGSNTTGAPAEKLGRRWIAMELLPEYLEASKFRFENL